MGEAGGGGGNATQRDPGYGKSDFVRLRALKITPSRHSESLVNTVKQQT